MEDKPDFGSTTQVIAWVRRRVTLRGLWGTIVALVLTLLGTITWLVNTHRNIDDLQQSSTQRQAHDTKVDALLQLLVNGQTAMNGKIDLTNGTVAAVDKKVDGLVNWREDIERAAEAPPHARRRGK